MSLFLWWEDKETSSVTLSWGSVLTPLLDQDIAAETGLRESFVPPYFGITYEIIVGYMGKPESYVPLFHHPPPDSQFGLLLPSPPARNAPHVSIKGWAILSPLPLDPHPRVTWDKHRQEEFQQTPPSCLDENNPIANPRGATTHPTQGRPPVPAPAMINVDWT